MFVECLTTTAQSIEHFTIAPSEVLFGGARWRFHCGKSFRGAKTTNPYRTYFGPTKIGFCWPSHPPKKDHQETTHFGQTHKRPGLRRFSPPLLGIVLLPSHLVDLFLKSLLSSMRSLTQPVPVQTREAKQTNKAIQNKTKQTQGMGNKTKQNNTTKKQKSKQTSKQATKQTSKQTNKQTLTLENIY